MLDKNVTRLNEFFSEIPISFYIKNDTIIVREEIPYYISSNPTLKGHLKYKYNVIFSNDKKWHVSKEGMQNLSTNLLKLQPTLPFDQLKRKLFFYINLITDKSLQQAVKNTINQLPEYLTSPASIRRHHSYQHGLLEHSIQLVESALALWKINDQHDNIDKDILIAGGLLHDIGKCHSYIVEDGINSKSDMLVKQDHIFHGGVLVEKYLKDDENKSISDEIKNKILHIIASHHTIKKWGAAVEPHSLEAWIIAACDNVSAQTEG